jgi:hypothetical protein
MTSTPVGATRTVQRNCGVAALDEEAQPPHMTPSKTINPSAHDLTVHPRGRLPH